MSVQEVIKNIPRLPGVYIFKDAHNVVLYVGKAKSLKNRVQSYFRNKNDDWKVAELIKEHVTIECIITKNEIEALLLEAQLIQDFKPKYNTLLKSGNPFLYILFTPTEIKLVRVKKEKGQYFGPFLHKKEARSTYDYLLKTFKLQMCAVKIPGGCLEYHLGNCAGSCKIDFDLTDYKIRLELALQAFEGNHAAFLKTIEQQMRVYIKNLEFEKARTLSIYLQNIDKIFATIKTGFTEKKYAQEVMYATSPLRRPDDELMQGLSALQELLDLPVLPQSIDCFDISHFQSTHIVGSCVRFVDGRPDKNKCRRFKIRSLTGQNDYAALQEIVQRRYKLGDFPDIILIDGGKGQRNAVRHIFPQIPCISIAKREETLFTDFHPEGLVLDVQTHLGQLIIALRDYAHHFAISYHKLLRKKSYSN
ncbi:MAG: GIY-YIG nuclease family protein [Candidatus Babeliaceae bacterium]|jgi:excinuclease ABC subunit C